MVWYDFVILAILAYTAWQGAQKGLVTQLAWIAAIILCFKFADKLAPAIEGQINVEQPLRHWIAMFILYLGFSLGSFLAPDLLGGAKTFMIGSLIEEQFKGNAGNWPFGAAASMILLTMVLILLMVFARQSRKEEA